MNMFHFFSLHLPDKGHCVLRSRKKRNKNRSKSKGLEFAANWIVSSLTVGWTFICTAISQQDQWWPKPKTATTSSA